MFHGSFDSTQCEKLEDYMPIPWGGLKMLAGTINVLVLLAGAVALWIFISRSFSNPMVGFCISGGLFLAIATYFATDARCEWVKSYFQRNVVGYLARFWVPEKAIDGTKWLCDIVDNSGDESTISRREHLGGLEIEIPLGGWFSKFFRTRILWNGECIFQKDSILNWSIRTRDISLDSEYVFVELRYVDGGFIDDRVQMKIEDAIRMIDFIRTETKLSFFNVIRHYMEECQRLANENSRLAVDRQDVDELIRTTNQKRDSCIRALHDLDSIISSTDRLKDTGEGLTVWEKVLNAIYHYDESDDRTDIEMISGQLTSVRRKLDELKRGSSRRRGKVVASS